MLLRCNALRRDGDEGRADLRPVAPELVHVTVFRGTQQLALHGGIEVFRVFGAAVRRIEDERDAAVGPVARG